VKLADYRMFSNDYMHLVEEGVYEERVHRLEAEVHRRGFYAALLARLDKFKVDREAEELRRKKQREEDEARRRRRDEEDRRRRARQFVIYLL
jgi:hypothetical protein